MKYILERSVKATANIGVIIVVSNDGFKECRNRFYSQKKIFNYPALVVVDKNSRLVGILTEKDIEFVEKRTDLDMQNLRVEDVCNKNARYISIAELEIHKNNNTDPFDGLPPSISFMPVVDDKKFFETFVYNIKFYNDNSIYMAIDIVDSCQLECIYCARGIGWMKNSKRDMDLDTFQLVIKKAKDFKINVIDIGNWAEIFLKKDAYKYMEILRDNDIFQAGALSNFSFAKIQNFDNFLESGFSKLYVSVSGFTQETYEKYHKGGNLEYVKRNLEYASNYKIKHNINGDIIVRYLHFNYNNDEIIEFEKYAYQLGLSFERRKGLVGISPNPSNNETDRTIAILHRYHTVKSKQLFLKNVCHMFKTFALDCEADAYLCSCKPNYACTKIGNFLSDSYEDMMINKLMNPVCQICSEGKPCSLPDRVKAEINKRINT